MSSRHVSGAASAARAGAFAALIAFRSLAGKIRRRLTATSIVNAGSIAAVTASILLGGCAYSYVDEGGARHIIGIVDVTIAPSGDTSTYAGDVVDVSSIGFSLTQTAQGTDVAAGYNRTTFASLRDNSLVLGNPLSIRDYLIPAIAQQSADGDIR